MDRQGAVRVGSAPIRALSDLEQFLTAAQRLKGLTLELQARQTRAEAYQRILAVEIELARKCCESLAGRHPRLREPWKQVQAELIKPAEDNTTGEQHAKP
jgi:hypothetical protein